MVKVTDAGTYSPLWDQTRIRSLSESEEDVSIVPRSNFGIFRKCVIFFLATLLGFLAVIGTIDLSRRIGATNNKSSNSGPKCYCGNSVEEAISLGCKFVPMAAAWLPAHCRDDYLEMEFNSMGPNPDHSWNFYADYERTTTIDLDTIANSAESTTNFYSEWEAHVIHCMFYWRKLLRSQFSGVVVEPRYNSDAHIAHCTRLILSKHIANPMFGTVTFGHEIVSEEEQKLPVAWDDVREMLATVNHSLPG